MKAAVTSITPFKIDIKQEVLDDLQRRLSQTRWPGELPGSEWKYGTNLEYMKELASYWQTGFDWRVREQMLNSFEQYRAEIDGIAIHFLHIKGTGHDNIPLLLLHGFPDCYTRMLKLIPLLTNPVNGKGDPQSFDLIIPSLPGFGFSDKPSKAGYDTKKIAHLINKLMTEILQYDQFAAHGGDWGGSVIEQLAIHHRGSLLGLHMTDIPNWRLNSINGDNLSESGRDYIKNSQNLLKTLGGFAMLQSQRPQNLSFGMNDSPVGLAAYFVDLFRSWSDCGGEIELRFTKDELLTNIMIYWVTQTFESAVRIYYESAQMEQSKGIVKIEVPTGFAVFTKDLLPAPREVGELFYNIMSWTEMPQGGHFAALEEPELLARDLANFFFNTLRDKTEN